MDRLNQIEELFKPVIDWKKQLRHFFNSVSREGKEYKFLKNRVATRNPVVRPSRYAKYDERKFEIEDGITQIFFLIDNSGSMYGQARSNGNSDIFNMLWSEIIGLLKSTSVKHCALTYFSDGPIDPNNVRTWDERTSKTQIMKMVK